MEKEIEYVEYDNSQETFLKGLIFNAKNQKFIIISFLVVGLICGLIVGITTPNIYQAETVVLPQTSGGSSLSKKYNIASLIGFNLGQQDGNDISPMLYPKLAENVNFRKKILSSKVNLSSDDITVTYSNYLSQYKKKSILEKLGDLIKTKEKVDKEIPSIAKDTFQINRPVYLNQSEKDQIDFLKENLTIEFDEEQGYIALGAKSQDPLVASMIVSNAQELLENLIIEINVQKSINELDFIQNRLIIAKDEYASKMAILGAFRDRNQYSITSKTSNREEQLKSEYDLSYQIYSELLNQRESTKLQIAKQTPIFSTIKPIVVPAIPEGPGTLKTIFLYVLVSVVLSLAYVSLKPIHKLIKSTLSF